MSAAWEHFQPEWGFVLGSGLGGFIDHVEVLERQPYASVEGLPQSKVAGHAGEFVLGRLAGTLIVAACGRVHLYEGWSAQEVTSHVRWLDACGIRRLVLTNAAGSLNSSFAPGDWMLLTDHLNLTGASPLTGRAHFLDLTEVYSRDLRERFAAVAQAEDIALHEGVYASVPGPQYETPAEIRMLRTLGADAVGMSTVLEAIQARALRLEVVAFSCLTNWAAGIATTPLSHEEVMATGRIAAEQFARLIARALERER
jgi:purine-nucleoside phosphorylase